jgi:hypothetical protein
MPPSERCPDLPSALPPARVLGGLRIDFGKKCDHSDDVGGIQPRIRSHVKESNTLRTLQRLDQPSGRRRREKSHRSGATARSERMNTPHGRWWQRTASRGGSGNGTPSAATAADACRLGCRPQGPKDAIAEEVPPMAGIR